jgi:hypothetical protein
MGVVEDTRIRLIRSLSSLGAFIFDRRLIDSGSVESILSSFGVSSLLSRADIGDLVIYYVDTSRFKRKCLYERCSMEDAVARDACLRECLMLLEKEVVRVISEALSRSSST